MKNKKLPTTGFTFIETISEGGSDLITSTGEKVGAVKKNTVIAVSKKDEETSEWKVGDTVELSEGAKGYIVKYGEKEVACMPNGFIIAVESK